MIYTVTLNPILEKTVEIEELIYDDVNFAANEKRYVRARGVDVSRVIKELGGLSVATGIIGGYNGDEIEDRLTNEGITCDFVKVGTESGSRINILQKRRKLRTVIEVPVRGKGPDTIECLSKKLRDIPAHSFAVISAHPKDASDTSIYYDLIKALKNNDVKVVFDADGEDLRQGIEAGPYIVKPNIHEFGRLIGRNVTDNDEIVREAETFLDTVPYLVISMGARGLIGVSREDSYLVVPPRVDVCSSFGAGDCLIAGLVYALHGNTSFREALVLGAACGAASALNPENVLCKAEDVQRISGSVQIQEIKKN